VYIDDVVEGHILAMEKGKVGERYILGGENADYLAFFGILSEVSETKHKMFHLPLLVMMAAAYAMLFFAGVTGKSPMIIPALVRKFHHNFPLNIMKARSELGYEPVSLKEGISKTLQWLKNESNQ
jgi:farnesol dehydrogenase